MHPTFADFLEVRLASELPGWQAQLQMAPRVPRLKEPPPESAARSRTSSVLVLLVHGEDDYELLLTVRSSGLSHHSGQISFPGGRVEPGEDLWSAAVREAWEEVGLEGSDVRSLGRLSSLYVPVSDSIINPMVAVTGSVPTLVPNPDEVEEIVFVPLSLLVSETNLQQGVWTLGGRQVEVPYWEIHRVPLWGTTAMILSELLAIYREYTGLFG